MAGSAGGEDHQPNGMLIQDTHKGINRKTRMRLSGLDFWHPHQSFEEEERAGGRVPQPLAAVGKPASSVRGEKILRDLVD